MKNLDVTTREVVVQPGPFRSPKVMSAVQGQTIREIVEVMYLESGTPEYLRGLNLVVEVDGVPVYDWDMVPPPNAHVLVYALLHDGGDGGKNPLRTILMIALVFAAPQLAGLLQLGPLLNAGVVLGGTMMMGLKIGIMAAGMFLVNMIAPVRMPSAATPTRESYADSPTYSIAGSQNRASPWGPIPVPLGRHRFYPPYAAEPYTEILGGDEYLRMLFAWYGPTKVENIRLGNTRITEFEGVELQVREGWPGDEDISLFPSSVFQDGVGVPLVEADGWVTRTARAGSDELSVDIVCPRGLVEFDNQGNRKEVTVEIEIEYGPTGGSDWTVYEEQIPMYVAGVGSQPIIGFGQADDHTPQHGLYVPVNDPGTWSVYVSNPEGVIYVRKGDSLISGSYRIAEYEVSLVTVNVDVGAYGDSGERIYGEISSLTNLEPFGVDGLICDRELVNIDTGTRFDGERFFHSLYQRITVTSGTAGRVYTTQPSFTGKTTSAVRRGFTWRVDRSIQYDVRVRRVTADSTDDQIIDGIQWLNMKSIVDDHPIAFPYPLGALAIKIKATEQLQNIVDELNFDVGTYASVWDSTEEEWQLPVTQSTVFNFRWGVATESVRAFPEIGTHSIYLKDGFEVKTNIEMYNEGLIHHEPGTDDKTGYTRVATFVVSAGTGDYSAQRRVTSLTNLEPAGSRGLTFEYSTRILTHFPPYVDGYNSKISVSGMKTTNNPAALMRHVLMHPANARSRTETQIDNEALGEWYEFCENAGFSYNGIRDFRSSVWDTCADIAATGRASPTLRGGTWSVAVDSSQKSVVQHITPRNSWGFSAEKTLSYKPHAFRVKFIDENNGYEWAERIVYDDGYDSSNATLFEQIEFPGITNSDLAWRLGRFHIAQARLRPEKYTVYQDFEHLVLYRGAKCRLSHDILLVGLGSGRIKSLTLDETEAYVTHLTVDETFTMEDGSTYGLWVRMNDQTGGTNADGELYLSVVTEAGQVSTLELSSQLPIADAPEEGDLVSFGVTDRETLECLVHSVQHHSDYSAQISLVPYAEEIYDADKGQIAEWDPVITQPIDVTKQRPKPPEIRLEAGEAAVKVDKYGATSRIIVNLKQPGNVRTGQYRVRYRPYRASIVGEVVRSDSYPWLDVVSDSKTLICGDVQDKVTYEVQAKSISVWGVASLWSDSEKVYVIGQSEPPADVENFSVNIVGGEAHLSWNPVLDRDLSHYVIRWSPLKAGASWLNSVEVVSRVARPATSVSVPVMIGSYLIKAVDYANNESVNATVITTAIARVSGLNVVETIEQETPDWDEDNIADGASYQEPYGGVALERATAPPGSNLVTTWVNDPVNGWSDYFGFSGDDDEILSAAEFGATPKYFYTDPFTMDARRPYVVKLERYVFGGGVRPSIYFAASGEVETPVSDELFPSLLNGTNILSWVATGDEEILVFKSDTAGTITTRLGNPPVIEPEQPLLAEGTYTLSGEIDLGAVFTSRVYGEIESEGSDVQEDLYQLPDLYSKENLYSAQPGKYSAAIEIRTTDDDPAGSPTWSAWKTLSVGEHTARGYQTRLRLKGTPPNMTPVVTKVKLTVDMPDRTVMIAATVPALGTAVAFEPEFYATPALGLSLSNGQSGDYFTISGESASEFNIECFDSTGTSVERNIVGIAKGYGEKET